jgi:heme a synthase
VLADHVTTETPLPPSRAIGAWLLVVALMIVGQTVLGGITRLTGSGLSITEWKPIVGAIPPMSAPAWEAEFAKYKQIPQFQQLNAHFELADFKRIYFWEWLHRLWGRLLGAAFLLPLGVFALRRRLFGLGVPLAVIGALGALQGFLGWFMVASGLKDLVYVSHLRLAVHFVAAMVLLAAVYWIALGQLTVASHQRTAPGDRTLAWWLLGALALQFAYGAFVAGLKAALAAPTWPSMNGVFIPRVLLESAGDLVNNALTVQFIHRAIAYLLTAAVLLFYLRLLMAPAPGHWRWTRHTPAWAVLLQTCLGIAAVLNAGDPGAFVVLGALHQLGAALLMLSLLTVARLSRAADLETAKQTSGVSTQDQPTARV